ncbi:MAG: SRPBCC family protein [Solirubrobacterales bacterium]
MSVARRQAQIDAPVEAIWDLVGNPNRYPEWWPRIIETQCEGLGEGCTYKHVSKGPVGVAAETILIERLEDCREVRIRCLDTGTYMCWQLMEVRNGTFVDVEFGMEPARLPHKVFDAVAGRRFYRTWLEQSVAALRAAAEERTGPGAAESPDEKHPTH